MTNLRKDAVRLLRAGDAAAKDSPRNEEALLDLLERSLREALEAGRQEGVRDLAERLTRPGDPLRFRYRNWRGEERERTVRPLAVWWGSTAYHPTAEWLLRAIDEESGEARDFALSRVLEFLS